MGARQRGCVSCFLSLALRTALAVCCFGSSFALAEVSTVLRLSTRNFRLNFNEGGGEIADPEAELKRLVPGSHDSRIDARTVALMAALARPDRWMGRASPDVDRILKRLKDHSEALSARLEKVIDAIATKNHIKIRKDGTFKLLAVHDGTRFFQDYFSALSQEDPLVRAMGEALLLELAHASRAAGAIEKVVSKLHSSVDAVTFLLPSSRYSEDDLRKLQAMSKGGYYRFEKIGQTWLIGSGFGYLITRDLLRRGEKLSDPVLRSRFEKILRYHEQFNAPIEHEYLQGLAAHFNPVDGTMGYALPSAGDLNAFVHEMTHSRFEKFKETLSLWLEAKGYLVPYQVDGPIASGGPSSFQRRGLLFDLLDEVNSWRMGESFESGWTDAQILKALVERYGPQAGREASELLENVWTSQKLAGKSIPYLIYDEIRRFNKMSLEDGLYMGLEGVEQNDLVKKMNFLILMEAKRYAGSPLEADAYFVVSQILRSAREEPVRRKLISLFGRMAEEALNRVPKAGVPAQGSSQTLTQAPTQPSALIPANGPGKTLDGLIEHALAPISGTGAHEAIKTLEALFDREKIHEVAERAGSHMRYRAPIEGSPLLKAFDEALAARLYDGKPAAGKLDLLNFIADLTHPHELPQTFALTESLLANSANRSRSDVWLAKHFFMPANGEGGTNGVWGEFLAAKLRTQPITAEIREAIAIHYQQSTAQMLSADVHFGTYASKALNEAMYRRTKSEIAKLSGQERQRLESSSRHLWELFADNEPSVRTAALYAMLSNPMFVVRNEGRIIHALEGHSGVDPESLEFLLDAAAEVLPQASRIYGYQLKKGRNRAASSGLSVKNSCSAVFQ